MNSDDLIDIERIQVLKDLDSTMTNELLNSFINESDDHMKRIQDAIEKLEVKELIYGLHNYRGVCSNLGLSLLSKKLETLEGLVRKDELDNLKEYYNELKECLEMTLPKITHMVRATVWEK